MEPVRFLLLLTQLSTSCTSPVLSVTAVGSLRHVADADSLSGNAIDTAHRLMLTRG